MQVAAPLDERRAWPALLGDRPKATATLPLHGQREAATNLCGLRHWPVRHPAPKCFFHSTQRLCRLPYFQDNSRGFLICPWATLFLLWFSAIVLTYQCGPIKLSSPCFICEALSPGTKLLCSRMSRCKSFAIRLGKQPLRKKEQTADTLRMYVATFTIGNRPSIKASAHDVEADLFCVMVVMAHSMGAATIPAVGSR